MVGCLGPIFVSTITIHIVVVLRVLGFNHVGVVTVPGSTADVDESRLITGEGGVLYIPRIVGVVTGERGVLSGPMEALRAPFGPKGEAYILP